LAFEVILLTTSCIGRLLADLADVDWCAGLPGNLLAFLLWDLSTFLSGNTDTSLLRNLGLGFKADLFFGTKSSGFRKQEIKTESSFGLLKLLSLNIDVNVRID
jgi:hypothetical protein